MGAPRNIRNITVNVEADGFYISIRTEIEVADPKPASDSMIGVYLGVVRFVTTSVDKVSTSLSKNHAVVVVVEDLKVKNRSASASGTLENPGRNIKAKSGLH
jgi:transposase